MAVDEALLESAARDHVLSLRLYRWSEPTLSLGYFQRYEDRRGHEASLSCACVRRASGGGAILHDRELTYSLAVPAAHPLARQAPRLYRVVHEALANLLNRDEPLATLAADATAEEGLFLCFLRHMPGDVLAAGHKILGSAQRRFRGAVLQHGSILLAASPAAPELPGIAEICRPSNIAEQLPAFPARLLKALSLDGRDGELTPQERIRAEQLAETKYGHESWTRRR